MLKYFLSLCYMKLDEKKVNKVFIWMFEVNSLINEKVDKIAVDWFKSSNLFSSIIGCKFWLVDEIFSFNCLNYFSFMSEDTCFFIVYSFFKYVFRKALVYLFKIPIDLWQGLVSFKKRFYRSSSLLGIYI